MLSISLTYTYNTEDDTAFLLTYFITSLSFVQLLSALRDGEGRGEERVKGVTGEEEWRQGMDSGKHTVAAPSQ